MVSHCVCLSGFTQQNPLGLGFFGYVPVSQLWTAVQAGANVVLVFLEQSSELQSDSVGKGEWQMKQIGKRRRWFNPDATMSTLRYPLGPD